MVKIALYGLSANPIHNAHLAIVKKLSQEYDLVFVWAVDNPDKYGSPDWLNIKMREEMVDLALKDLRLRNVMNTPQWSDPWTGKSVQMIRKEYPEHELWIALGSDSIQTVSTWSGGELMSLADGFIEIKRPGVTPGPKTITINKKEMPVVQLDIVTPPYSSTEIRKKFKVIYKETSDLSEMLPVSVLIYLAKHLPYKP